MNAGNLMLEEIAARQSLIGEYDLFKGSSEAYSLRTQFITAFYAYVKDGGYAYGLAGESACPTLLFDSIGTCGAGVFACQPAVQTHHGAVG
jgi:hypothetical protein